MSSEGYSLMRLLSFVMALGSLTFAGVYTQICIAFHAVLRTYYLLLLNNTNTICVIMYLTICLSIVKQLTAWCALVIWHWQSVSFAGPPRQAGVRLNFCRSNTDLKTTARVHVNTSWFVLCSAAMWRSSSYSDSTPTLYHADSCVNYTDVLSVIM